mgnify:CR=1 FL=1
MSELEQDFEKIAEQINVKIKEAAASLKQANELATKAGLPGLIYSSFLEEDLRYEQRHLDPEDRADDYEETIENKLADWEEKLGKIDVGPLEAELGDGGWSTSSSYC